MAEKGIDISEQQPKHLKEFLGHIPVKFLITVCGEADTSCPRVWPGMVDRLHWPFNDPAAFKGTPEETLNEFRRVRDEIKEKILTWLKEVK